MNILIGKSSGFCSGVQRAIKGAEQILKDNKKIYCFGEIIHNPAVVNSLKQQGMDVVYDISAVPEGSKFIIRSHGLEDDIFKKAIEKKLDIYDFTCPLVKKIHRLVIQLTEEGYFIIITGNAMHPEVKAIASLAKGNARVIENLEGVKTLPAFKQNAVVAQTTFNPDSFFDIVKEIITRTKKILVCNTLCEETIKRQKEAVHLAEKVDLVVVVGGKNSSNTKTLYNIIKNKVQAVHVEDASELDRDMFKNIGNVGIISGASTPEEEVKKVHDVLVSFQILT